LPPKRDFQLAEAGDVPTRAVEPWDEAAGYGIGHAHKDDRDRPRLRRRATVGGVEFATMMSGCRPTNSCETPWYRLVADTAEWLTAAPGTRHDNHLRSKVAHM
jgi:hypothetical protein